MKRIIQPPSVGRFFVPILLLLVSFTGAYGDTLRGHVRHFVLQIPVRGATIVAEDVNEVTRREEVRSNALGFFELAQFRSGQTVRLTATHPAYRQEIVVLQLAEPDTFRSIEMNPLDDISNYHTINVQILGAVTQVGLKGVPVTIKQLNQSDNVVRSWIHVTGRKGAIELQGARTGQYAFEINRPSAGISPKQKYESYVTPTGKAVSIESDHLMNVFLKPEPQKLRVRVRGYDFKTKKDEATLGGIRVDLTGFDPDDRNLEVLHTRSEFTQVFEGLTNDQGTITVDPDSDAVGSGEVLFTNLPPVAYEVKISRLGYLTATHLIQPGPDGTLPNDSGRNTLQVDLIAERNFPEIVATYPQHRMTTYDEFGQLDQPGIQGLGLSVRLVGIENSNTAGLVYTGETGQNLRGDVIGQFFNDNVMCGRYRVFVDGISTESVKERGDFGFGERVSPDYHLEAFGEGVLEILPTQGIIASEAFPKGFVDLTTPNVTFSGQLVAAESLERTTGEPIYRGVANQEVVFQTIERDNHLIEPTVTSVTTDGEGYFSATVLPGIFGVRVPGMEEYFGDSIVIDTTEAAFPEDADRSARYEWPLVDTFPEVNSTDDGIHRRYFALGGIPIHAARTQFLELRLKRERYYLDAFGRDQSGIRTKVIARTADKRLLGTDFSYVISQPTEVALAGPNGPVSTRIQPRPPASFGDPLLLRWENLRPGDYGSISATIPAHRLIADGFAPKTFIDWPSPGVAPTAEQAALFFGENIPNNELIWEPMTRIDASRRFDEPSFTVELLEYTPNPITVLRGELEIVNGERKTVYEAVDQRSFGGIFEVNFAPGYYDGFAELGGPVTAFWTTGEDKDGKTYPVRVEAGGKLKLGGDEATPETPLPDLSFTLDLAGFAHQDENSPIEGANFELRGTGKAIKTGTPLPKLKELPEIMKAGGDNYTVATMSQPIVVNAAANPTLRIEVGLEQGMEVKATVSDSGTPTEGVSVSVHNRYGRKLATETSDAKGELTFNGIPGSADIFLVSNAPGYQPARQRLRVADAQDGTDASTAKKHDVPHAITLLHRPTFFTQGIPLDRWGPFFRNVTRSGNVSLAQDITKYGFFQAADTLKATWRVEVTPATLDYSVPSYDNSDGSPGMARAVKGPDKIVAAYLVDHRRFQKNNFRGSTVPLENEESFLLPPGESPVELAATMRELIAPAGSRSGPTGRRPAQRQRRVYVDKASSIQENKATGRTVITGDFQLWDLPPKDFKPVIVVQTASGAYRKFEVDYRQEEHKQLEGIVLPPWLANLLDFMGVAAGTRSNLNTVQERYKELVPDGFIVPLPEFNAEIKLDKQANETGGYIDYIYSLGVSQEVGQENKSSGLLSLSAGFLGAKIAGQGVLKSIGRTNAVAFTLDSSIATTNILSDEYASKLGPPKDSSVEVTASGKITTTAVAHLGKDNPLQFSLTNNVAGAATAIVELELNQYARPLPYVGPVIGFLGDSDALDLNLKTSLTAALGQQFSFRTYTPQEVTFSTRTDDDDFAPTEPSTIARGGLRFEPTRTFCLGIGYTSGLELDIFKGSTKASATFVVGGDGCGSGSSALDIKYNELGTWPLINSIKGKAELVVDAKADYGIAKPKWEWKYEIIKFDVQFGTETLVQHIPYQTRYGDAGDLAMRRNHFVPTGPRVIDDQAESASYTLADEDGSTLVYSSNDPQTGQDIVKISVRNPDQSWSDPQDLFRSQRLGPVTALERADGSTLIAYVELSEGADPYDPLGMCTVQIRTLGSDGSVTEAQTIGHIKSPHELRLVESSNRLGLVIATAQLQEGNLVEGLLTTQSDNGLNWSEPQQQASEQTIAQFDVLPVRTATEDPFLLTWRNGEHQLSYKFLGEPARTFTEEIQANSTVEISKGKLLLVGASNTGELTLWEATAPDYEFAPQHMIQDAVDATELALRVAPGNDSDQYVIAWTEAFSLGSEIYYLVTNSNGTTNFGPVALTQNPQGRYEHLALGGSTPDTTYVLSRFINGSNRELRHFAIALSAGRTPDDIDQDQLPDLSELRIVDTHPDDAINSIEDVRSGDDFDGDGFANGAEILAGSDPISINSIPNIDAAQVTLELVDGSASEWNTDDVSTFRIRRLGDVTEALAIDVAFQGTAVQGTDYAVLAPQLTIPAGSGMSDAISIVGLPDTEAEGPETIQIQVLPSSNYTVGDDATITIILSDRPFDAWRHIHFGPNANTAIAAPDLDLDGDGIANLMEYAFRLDPLTADSKPGLTPRLHVDETGGVFIELDYPSNPEATDIHYQLQGSSAITEPFSQIGSAFSTVNTTDLADGRERITLRADAPIGPAQSFFYRLVVQEETR